MASLACDLLFLASEFDARARRVIALILAADTAPGQLAMANPIDREVIPRALISSGGARD